MSCCLATYVVIATRTGAGSHFSICEIINGVASYQLWLVSSVCEVISVNYHISEETYWKRNIMLKSVETHEQQYQKQLGKTIPMAI